MSLDSIRERLDASPDDRAVSPVVGVILMVAITVILSAVIGTFVLDLGQSVGEIGPTASMSFEDHDDTFDPDDGNEEGFIEFDHQGGDELDGDDLKIIVRNTSNKTAVAIWNGGPGNTDDDDVGGENWDLNSGSFVQSDTVNVGDVITLSLEDDGDGTAGDIGTESEFSITVFSTETDNRIAAGTIDVE